MQRREFMKLLGGVVAGLSIANFVLALSSAIVAQERALPEFTFGLISDLGYAPAEEPLLENVFAELNRTPLAFVVHVGDLGSPNESTIENFTRVDTFGTPHHHWI
jgi:hypothetical protein